MNDLLIKYNKLNNSFKKKYIYHFGKETGFFSEYNNMLLAMLYCLDHKIKFVLYSKDVGFAFKKGWRDYFLPFCPEKKFFVHKFLNYKFPVSSIKSNRFLSTLYKFLFQIDYTTIELWELYRSREFETTFFSIPELGINGDVRQACGILQKMTWQYNQSIGDELNSMIKSLNLPDVYVGLHVRAGDKYTEHKLDPLENYFSMVESHSDIQAAFISTDDYTIIEEARKKYPEWNIYTLSAEQERGYFHDRFQNKRDFHEKKCHYCDLFASMDVLSKSDCFVGTFTSNIGMYLGIRMEEKKCFGVDLNKWKLV